MPSQPDILAAADETARNLAQTLLTAKHASLSYANAETGRPSISRIAFGMLPDGPPVTLISSLAPHYDGLRSSAHCALMVGEPADRGDPLTHPRLMIHARASFVSADDPQRSEIRRHWLASHPKSKLYVDFADFSFVTFEVEDAVLNAGFAKAFRMTPEDLR